MVSSEVQRTLVKSAPELWAELSDEAALARHLSGFRDVRITGSTPEERIEWEAQNARGTVHIKPSGWGTRVTLTLRRDARAAPAAPELSATHPPAPATEPARAAEPEPEPELSPTHVVAPASERARAAEPDPEPPPGLERPAQPQPAAEPGAALARQPEPEPKIEPETPVGPELERDRTAAPERAPGPERTGELEPEPSPTADLDLPAPRAPDLAPHRAFLSRLRRQWHRAFAPHGEPPATAEAALAKAEARLATTVPAVPDGDAARARTHTGARPPHTIETPHTTAATPEPTAPARTLASQAQAPARLAPAPMPALRPREPEPQISREGAPPSGASDLSAELRAAEETGSDEDTLALTAVLDSLGAAHHRPFSRA